ncbi:MAG: sensor histidine kinase [Marinobacter sp.]|uniref:sensor histidine kinase n=1 Tax=Marinobacter sp. TaxID=50741 RepID=UPI00299E0591|nr:sensor histidine kinase [Marinobacter sp.]MDX1634855.1 sensor histidine kinase [Marinobacter sp.]
MAGSIITVFAVFTVAYQQMAEDLERLLTEQQRLEAQRVARTVDQGLDLRTQALELLTHQLSDGDQLLPATELNRLLARQERLHALFPAGLLVFDENATALAETLFVEGRLGTNYSDRQHFREAMASGKTVVSRPLIGRKTGLPLLSVVAPILAEDGDLIGLAGGAINLDETSILPLRASDSSGTLTKVVDTDNFLFVDTNSASGGGISPLPDPGQDPLIDAALSGLSLGQVTLADGQRYLYATDHLQRLGWLFIRAVPYERVLTPLHQSFLQLLLICLLIALVLAALSFGLTRSTMAPLDRMANRIQGMGERPARGQRLEESGPRETRNLASAFNQLMAERDLLDELKDGFISSVSHELRTPLTSINGALKLLNHGVGGPLPAKAAQMSQLAQRNGERLQQLINDLLDFNKLEAGKLSVKLLPTELAPVINDAILDNSTLAGNAGVRLSCDTITAPPVITDAHRLRQILDNFISNAIKFSPAGAEVRITVEARGEQTRIKVSDQGPGVPARFRSRIFERFAQAETGSERAGRGTGLGLAICRELATLMFAEVGFYNDQGAHFWIEVPNANSPAISATEGAASETTPATGQ